MAISKRTRLTGREFRGGRHRSLSTPYFSLKTMANEVGGNRIGVVVSAAVHKNAAKRNFWKRQAREALRSLPKSSKDLLAILFPKVNTLTKKQFREKIIAAAAEPKFKKQ